MANMDVSVILRLVDQLSGPAKKVAESLKTIVTATNQIKKIGDNFKSVNSQVTTLQSDLRGLTSSFRDVANASRALTGSMKMNSEISWARKEVAAMRDLAKAQQQVIANNSKMARSLAPHARNTVFGHPYGITPYRIGHGITSTFDKAGTLDSELAMLDLRNWSAEQKKKIIAQSLETSRAVPQITQAQALHMLGEIAYASGSLDFGLKHLTDLAKTNQVISSLDPLKKAGFHDQVMEIVKSGELKNYVANDEQFKWWLDTTAKMAISSGGIVTPSVSFQALKYTRSAIHGYSDDFMRQIFPEIVQEMITGKGGGARGGAGPSLAAFKRMFVDQTFSPSYIPQWIKAGLIDPSKVIYGRNGPKRLAPGAVYDQELAGSNPFLYMQKRLMPWLESQGIVESKFKTEAEYHNAIVRKITELGGTDIGKQLLQLMVIQRKQMQLRAGMTNQAAGFSDAYIRMMETYRQNVEALKSQTDQLLAVVTLPFLPMINRIIGNIVAALKAISAWASNNPGGAAAGIGVFGVGASALLLRAVLGRGMLGMLLGGGLGFLTAGPTGAMLGALLGRGVVGGAAAGGLIGSVTSGFMFLARGLTLLLNPLGAAVALLGALGFLRKNTSLLDPEPTGRPNPYRRANDARRREFNEQRARLGLMPLGGFETLTIEDIGAALRLNQRMSLNDVRARLGMSPLLGDYKMFSADAEKSGTTWGQTFLNAVRAIISGSSVPGPAVTLPPIGGAPAPDKTSAPQQRSDLGGVRVGAVHVHVNGAQDPHAVAKAVQTAFSQAVSRHLSDGAYA